MGRATGREPTEIAVIPAFSGVADGALADADGRDEILTANNR